VSDVQVDAITKRFGSTTALDNVSEGLTTVLKWPKERARSRALELLDHALARLGSVAG